jgi:hypothetical protein
MIEPNESTIVTVGNYQHLSAAAGMLGRLRRCSDPGSYRGYLRRPLRGASTPAFDEVDGASQGIEVP